MADELDVVVEEIFSRTMNELWGKVCLEMQAMGRNTVSGLDGVQKGSSRTGKTIFDKVSDESLADAISGIGAHTPANILWGKDFMLSMMKELAERRAGEKRTFIAISKPATDELRAAIARGSDLHLIQQHVSPEAILMDAVRTIEQINGEAMLSTADRVQALKVLGCDSHASGTREYLHGLEREVMRLSKELMELKAGPPNMNAVGLANLKYGQTEYVPPPGYPAATMDRWQNTYPMPAPPPTEVTMIERVRKRIAEARRMCACLAGADEIGIVMIAHEDRNQLENELITANFPSTPFHAPFPGYVCCMDGVFVYAMGRVAKGHVEWLRKSAIANWPKEAMISSIAEYLSEPKVNPAIFEAIDKIADMVYGSAPSKQPETCTCDIAVLMTSGCKCGRK